MPSGEVVSVRVEVFARMKSQNGMTTRTPSAHASETNRSRIPNECKNASLESTITAANIDRFNAMMTRNFDESFKAARKPRTISARVRAYSILIDPFASANDSPTLNLQYRLASNDEVMLRLHSSFIFFL